MGLFGGVDGSGRGGGGGGATATINRLNTTGCTSQK